MSKRRPSCQPMGLRTGFGFERALGRWTGFEPRLATSTEQLLAGLLSRAMRTFPESHFKRPLMRAAREALRLAERTGYASLLLPELFAELAIAEMLKAEYQRMGRI